MDFKLRRLEEKDDSVIAKIIRDCLIEYGGDHRQDTAWADPYLDHFSIFYAKEDRAYFVAENDQGEVVSGVGIGPIGEDPRYCELQKMYCKKEYRGTGVSALLLDTAFSFAKKKYRFCYLETLENMIPAQKFYEKHGFKKTEVTIGSSGHTGCNWHYIIGFSEI